ncbi:hypothetical protein D3C75_1151300 [compost metagenome]
MIKGGIEEVISPITAKITPKDRKIAINTSIAEITYLIFYDWDTHKGIREVFSLIPAMRGLKYGDNLVSVYESENMC